MKIKYLPDCHCLRPTDIPPEFFKKLNCRLILCDLDNTLAKAQSKIPPKEAIDWVNSLKESGLDVAIVSNAIISRVKKFSAYLSAPYLGLAMKPHIYRITKFIRNLGYEPNEVVFIGDQMFTDIECAKKAGFKAVLCEIISEKETFWTYHNRKKDIKVRKIIKEEKSVPEWRDMK